MTRLGRLECRPAQGLGAGLRVLHGEAVELEAGAQEPPDLNLVVDHQNYGRFVQSSDSTSGWCAEPANGR